MMMLRTEHMEYKYKEKQDDESQFSQWSWLVCGENDKWDAWESRGLVGVGISKNFLS